MRNVSIWQPQRKGEPRPLSTLICERFEMKSLWEAAAPELFFPPNEGAE